MTISEPIPVAEAIEAVKTALEVCHNTAPGFFPVDMHADHRTFAIEVPIDCGAYRCVAPIVEWYRQTGAQGGNK